ncbi:MAG: hypothetical protein Hens3KO_22010 [Henriciella sp.]
MLFPNARDALQLLQPEWRWSHFSIAELACRCGGKYCHGSYWHAPDFLDRLEHLRADIGRPLVINSGHRCDQWNAAVGGAPLSQHKTIAVDIALKGHDRQALLRASKRAGFTGFGLARTFLHLDRRTRPAQWFYKGSQDLWQI